MRPATQLEIRYFFDIQFNFESPDIFFRRDSHSSISTIICEGTHALLSLLPKYVMYCVQIVCLIYVSMFQVRTSSQDIRKFC